MRRLNTYGSSKPSAFCTKCNVPARKLAIGNTVDPFWSRLPKIFLYPFHTWSLLFTVSIALATSLFSYFGVFAWLMQSIVLPGVVLKYSFAALKDTAHARLLPPKVTSESISEDFEVVFKQYAIFGVIGFLTFQLLQIVGPVGSAVFLGLAMLSLPAMIIILIVSGSLLSALNPWLFAKMAWRIGWGYLLMYFFLILLAVAPSTLGYLLMGVLPEGLGTFVFAWGECYYSIVAYHLMGYVMLQYHQETGWQAEEEDDPGSAAAEQEFPAQLTNRSRVEMFLKDGQLDDALTAMQEEARRGPMDLELAALYYKILKAKGLVPELLQLAPTYLDLLVKGKRPDALCETYRECLAHDPDFAPSPNTLFTIAGLLARAGDPKNAFDAYKRFIKSDERHPLVPQAYFFASKLLHEKLDSTATAVSALKFLLQKYPDHEIIPEVGRYLKIAAAAPTPSEG
jgi:tetratricopeptide (TPR) repeat protein